MISFDHDTITRLQSKLHELEIKPLSKKAIVGFDGFIDKIKKPVKTKHGNKEEYFATLINFAERIEAASGKSGQIEMVTQLTKFGGNAPILSNALGKLGIKNTCLGTLGYPRKSDAFSSLNSNCELISLLNPGASDAIEFNDGKIIFSDLKIFDVYDWKYIKKTADLAKIKRRVADSTLLAFVDWANLPHAYEIWDGALHDLIKKSGRTDFLFLFDLCDTTKRTTEDIDEILDLISNFAVYGKVTLCLNENEATSIWASLNGIDFLSEHFKSMLPSLEKIGDCIYKTMAIQYLLIHPIDRTLFYHEREIIEAAGMMVKNPKVMTGGGDNLNAGYALAWMTGMNVTECILLGMAASGAYVKNGYSPSIMDLIEHLEWWKENLPTQKEQVPIANYLLK